MSKKKRDEVSREGELSAKKKKRKGNLISFFLCLLIAVAIWLYASNSADEKKNQENDPVTVALQAESVSNIGSEIL